MRRDTTKFIVAAIQHNLWGDSAIHTSPALPVRQIQLQVWDLPNHGGHHQA
jgi:hypothetical protein